MSLAFARMDHHFQIPVHGGGSPANMQLICWHLQRKSPDVLNWTKYSQRAQMILGRQTLYKNTGHIQDKLEYNNYICEDFT